MDSVALLASASLLGAFHYMTYKNLKLKQANKYIEETEVWDVLTLPDLEMIRKKRQVGVSVQFDQSLLMSQTTNKISKILDPTDFVYNVYDEQLEVQL